ncbi:MAG: sulfatase-like hydrolase/transferase, partial [Planctomycetota bacterium]|nr:sulfatase-like hydrolase/transferase [Planctomycetota bacterium]
MIRLSSIFSGMWCVCLAMAFSLANQTEGLSAEPPRNVVFILSDDHRADVLGAAGHPIIKTPNLDRLASEGVRFENAFVTTSICAASRATLLTGLYERGHRYTFRTVPMAKTITDLSYPVLLRESGYRTGFVGKFGVGVQPGVQQQMFDFFKPLNRSPYFK